MDALKQILAITAADAQRRGIANPVRETFTDAELAEAHAHVAIAAAQVAAEQGDEAERAPYESLQSVEHGADTPASAHPFDADYDRDDAPSLQQERELMDLALDDPHRGAVPPYFKR